ncbi:MAG TPA: histidine phosphatase family protein [Gammaproteobacteria bacterium]|nr:histidine phosphatase family protein [Gammaproteobacteria bacterium]
MSTDTFIDLLRHGETSGGACLRGSIDDALTEFGLSQMRAAIDQRDPCWDHIISSPLKRCADFAHELARQHSIALTVDRRFQEIHFGQWEGCFVEDLMKTDADALTNFWNDPVKYTPPEAEPLLDFEVRIVAAWQEIIARHAGEKILLVTHGGVIRLLLCHILNHPVRRMLEFEVKHAAIEHIHIKQDGALLRL